MPVENAVLFGGKEYKTHAMWPSECYAFDILKEPYEVGSNNLDDYGIFGEDIYSPVSSAIIGMENNEIDIEPNSENLQVHYATIYTLSLKIPILTSSKHT